MSDLCSKFEHSESNPADDDVVQHTAVRAAKAEERPKLADGEIPPKKRKTRRGKSKRRQPYIKNTRKSNKLIKPEAPHNSNQFLLEDHGLIEELDENLKSIDQVSTSTLTRTRDSSFSVDSDGEFYSSPDVEEQFLIKDFDDQYETLHAERLQAMSRSQLIEDYIMLENKVELLSRRLKNSGGKEDDDYSEHNRPELKREVERLTIENERLRRENDLLRSKINVSDSEDSETDSSDSCSSSSSSSSSSCSGRSHSAVSTVDYTQTNGHSPPTSVDPV